MRGNEVLMYILSSSRDGLERPNVGMSVACGVVHTEGCRGLSLFPPPFFRASCLVPCNYHLGGAGRRA